MGCGYSRGAYNPQPKDITWSAVLLIIGSFFFLVIFDVLLGTGQNIHQQSMNANGQNDVQKTNEPVALPKEIQKRKNKEPKE